MPSALAEPSAKLDMLMEQLEEVVGAGHKALVFSQFTSLLAIVRSRLQRRGHDSTNTWMAPRATARSAWSASRTIPSVRYF